MKRERAKPGQRQRLLRDRRGATAVEFAIIAAPFIALLMATLQTAIIFFVGQALQSVTNAAARQLLVGKVQSQGLSQAQFKAAVCAAAPPLFTCGKLMVDVQSASSFSTLNTAPVTPTYNAQGQANNLNYTPGTQGSAVILRVMYDWPVFGGPLGIALSNESSGNRLLVATSVFKTEPYT